MLLDRLLRLRLAERHLRVVRLVHLREEEEQQTSDDQDRKQREQDRTPRGRQGNAVLDLGMRCHELAQRVLTDPGTGEVMLRSERLDLQDARLDGLKARAAIHDRAQLGIERLDARIERIRRRYACRLCGIVDTRNGLSARIIDDRFNTPLVDRLREFRRYQRVGLRDAVRRALWHAREHREEEDSHEREHHDRDDVDLAWLLVRLLVRRFVVLCVWILCHNVSMFLMRWSVGHSVVQSFTIRPSLRSRSA